jgi:hypothetical protein
VVRNTQCSSLSQLWQLLLLRRYIGGGLGVEPAGLPFWVIVITMYIYMEWNLAKFGALFGYVETYRLAAISGGALPDLAGPFFYF